MSEKKKQQLSPYARRLLKLIASSMLATLGLLFSIITILFVDQQSDLAAGIFAGVSSLCLAVMYFLKARTSSSRKYERIRFWSLSSIFFVLTVIAVLTFIAPILYPIFSFIFAGSFVVSSVFSIIDRPRIGVIIQNVLKSAVGFLIILFVVVMDFTGEQVLAAPQLTFIVIMLVMAFLCFALAMMVVFSGIKKSTIVDILKKTYAIEILYGLVILIFATSLVLMITEETDLSFGDALWYCFALVTTIGFGDVVATTTIGRILSVILGIYGIIVVALITSIIVNFYNETKTNQIENKLKKEMKELEKQIGKEDNPEKENAEEKPVEEEKE